jgi:two-component system response regulator FlrC
MARVLIVDDEPAIRLLLDNVLAGMGHTPLVVQDAETALALLHEQAVDLVVTDKNLPNMSGIELLAQIRSRWPALPVVLITGYASVDSALKAQELGASGFLVKPFGDIREVEEEVARVLHRRTVPPAADVERDLERASGRLAALQKKRA